MKETILSELERFMNKGNRHSGITEEDFEILLQFFQNYFGGKESNLIRDDFLENRINEILEEPDDFVYNLIQGIKSYSRDKSILTNRIIRFLDYLEIRYDVIFKKYEFDNFKINSQSERLLLILKYLHEGDKSRAQIAEAFGISERTLSEDLSILTNGFEFLGTEMKISKLERGTNNYKSHVHPVFLALNSAEMFAFTIGLKITGKDTVLEESFCRIADMIYKQLSYNAKDMIDNSKYLNESFSDEPLKFKNSLDAYNEKEIRFSYFLKDRTICNIKYKQDGEIKTTLGIIELFENDKVYQLDKIRVHGESTYFDLAITDVISIERSDKAEYFKDWV